MDKFNRVVPWALILVIYVAVYLVLRWKFPGYVQPSRADTKIVPVVITEGRIEMPVFKRRHPRYTKPFRIGLDALFFPASKVDESMTGKRLNFDD